MCGDGLCSGCGYSIETASINGGSTTKETQTLCNECYMEVVSMVNDDRNVGLLEEQGRDYLEAQPDPEPYYDRGV